MRAIVTGSGGLIGSEAVVQLVGRGEEVHGIDADLRKVFFGEEASVQPTIDWLQETSQRYRHHDLDLVTESEQVDRLFREVVPDLVIHCAAQPSHDWAATNPLLDWQVNASGTEMLLRTTYTHAPHATFVQLSTNKVYGDSVNALPLISVTPFRYGLPDSHPLCCGIGETDLPIDMTRHSLFGASKLAGDILAQEYGYYYGMKVGVFRGGCLTGQRHAGTRLHGFLSHLIKTAVKGTERYTVFGYEGKQVRDNIDSSDVVRAILAYADDPDPGASVYNIGGGYAHSISILEAAVVLKGMIDRQISLDFDPQPRIGDHQWWITSMDKFCQRYPNWKITKPVETIMEEMVEEALAL